MPGADDFIKGIKFPGELREQLGNTQEKLRHIHAVGEAGGGLVQVTLDGTMEMVSVKLDPVVVDNRDIEMLEQLIIAAHTDATRKAHEEMNRELASLAAPMYNQINGDKNN